MPEFQELDWRFGFNDRGTHSGNYLDKLNQLVTGFNTTINAYNAQLLAETDAQAQQALAEQFRNEALTFRNQAEAIALENIQGTNLDLASCKVGGVSVALIDGLIANATNATNADNSDKLGNQLPAYYAKQSDITALNAIVFSDDGALNEIQEIVDYIKLNRSDLDALSIASIAGLVAALAGKASTSHDHDSTYLGKTAKAQSALLADNSTLLAGRSSHHYRGLNFGSTNSDPNTTAENVILTNHANAPSSGFFYITTTFYSGITSTGNRGQIATSYNGTTQMYTRSCYSGIWTTWIRCDNLDPNIKIVRGENSNGKYVKFPDGTLICYTSVASNGTDTSIAFTYPHAFLAFSNPVTTAQGGNSRLVSASADSNGINFYAWGQNIVGAYVITSVRIMTIGRWK